MSDLTKRIITMSNQTGLSGADWREVFNMVEELESKLDYPHEEIAELEADRDRLRDAIMQHKDSFGPPEDHTEEDRELWSVLDEQ